MRNKQVYFETMSEALNEAFESTKFKGYEIIDENHFYEPVSYGQTNNITLELIKDGRLQRKCLQIQLYRMDSGKYELNYYIN